MPKKLSAEQIAGYERDGYVCPSMLFHPSARADGASGWKISNAPRAAR